MTLLSSPSNSRKKHHHHHHHGDSTGASIVTPSLASMIVLVAMTMHTAAAWTVQSARTMRRSPRMRTTCTPFGDYRLGRRSSTSLWLAAPRKNEDEDEEELFFDDFADFGPIGGESSLSSSMSADDTATSTLLQERIQQVQHDDTVKDTRLLQNYKTGMWEVRGFSLDPNDATTDIEDVDVDSESTHVCKIVLDHSQDGADDATIWVGRTNGDVVRVQLGSDYWTHFSSQLSATATADPNTSGNDPNKNDPNSNTIISVTSKLVRREEDSVPAAPTGDEDETRQPQQQPSSSSSSPFEILNQVSAVQAPIAHILSTESHLFTCGTDSGDIQQWLIADSSASTTDNDAADQTKMLPLQTMKVHETPIVALQTVQLDSNDEATILVSASHDGTLALWDIASGDLLYTCQIKESDSSNDAVPIECADVNGCHVYVGTATGQVLVYNVRDWMESAAAGSGSGDESCCPLPVGQWTVSEVNAVTSLACAGAGSLVRGSASPSSALILTGCANGTVKQWEVLSRVMESESGEKTTTRLEHWPRMAGQRLPKKAHLFDGHDMPVTALLPVDATKFLSASQDGTVRAWNPATGKELFRMDGFTDALTSLCLQDNMLITDGMNQFVSVHDFDVDPNDQGFELDFDNEVL